MITYRKMTANDIPAGLSLCRAAGWNQLSRDWEVFLRNNPDGAVVAVSDSAKILGTVTTLRYSGNFSWVGMVLVDPTMRRHGIGNGLLQQALRILSDEETVKLDATAAGRDLYLKPGFKDEYSLTRMHLDKINSERLPMSSAISLRKEDLADVLKLDREIFGADRTFILNWLLEGSPELAFITKVNDRITGYCLGRQGYNFTQIGPIVANNTTSATHLVTAAMRNIKERPVIIDVLHHTPEWNSAMEDLGFTELRQLVRMYKGSNAFPGKPVNSGGDVRQFAIAGPEFG
jgi:GNAT superfamily N-acetyltransferase